MTSAFAAPPGSDDEALARLVDVQRRRRTESLTVVLTSIAVGQLLFASFAFGHSRGPMRLSWTEMAAGMLGAILIAAFIAAVVAKGRKTKGATWTTKVTEGQRKRRVAVFEKYAVVDDEVVLFETVQKADIENDVLLVRYRDPRVGGPVLREFTGKELVRLARVFRQSVASAEPAAADA